MRAESDTYDSVIDEQPGDAAVARRALVERLQADGVLTDPRLREALSCLDRGVLLPRAYVRRSEPGTDPVVWKLLDGTHPKDRAEWQELVYSGESVLVQRDGEPLEGQVRGAVSGGRMTAMSTFTPYTVEVLQMMRIAAGHNYLDLGTGPGVSLALAAALTGPRRAVGVERDGHMAAFARNNLDRLGVGATMVAGDALDGHVPRAPYDRIHSGIGVPCLPSAWVDQLAPGGRLLTTLVTRAPSWPGHCLVTRTATGRIEAVLEGGPRGHRPLHGYTWLTAQHHLAQVADIPGRPRTTTFTPPADEAYGFWLSAAYLVPGWSGTSRPTRSPWSHPRRTPGPWPIPVTEPSASTAPAMCGPNSKTSTSSGHVPGPPTCSTSTSRPMAGRSTSRPAPAPPPWNGYCRRSRAVPRQPA